MNKKIVIKDRIYGNHEITEPVLMELIKSKPFQRLKFINQFGIPDQYYHKKNFTRYEHSLGVMILIKILNGSLEEQIAGLLHDISHTAFSHVIDWVCGDILNESYQDNQHQDFIETGEIRKILDKYSFDYKRISDYHNFSLLEKDSPDLCADRVDYSLREFPSDIPSKLLKSIINKDNEIIFNNEKSAFIFGINFLKLQRNHWAGFEGVYRYRLFSNALKMALEDKIIDIKDFYKDDNFVVKKLIKTKNPKIKIILKTLSSKKLKKNYKNYEVLHKKFRNVNPKFLSSDGKVKRLSEENDRYRIFFEKERTHTSNGIKIPSSLPSDKQ